ncbi:MAG: Alkaline phosphatase [uncultured Rubrobacteraceae bacterium]|uniref:Alkaline phosphatase n=1 Tax=uncultured Rubrobacteraceae bacterium TaxID=349277 RepID=A0A6J4P722_9ACTN|nr:MAG: Alkaline phosphatase [uncultured Rubrobacteraceae bacterium]
MKTEALAALGRIPGRFWLSLLLATAVASVGLVAVSGPAASQEDCGPGYATDHILVKMEAGASAESVEKMEELNGAGAEEESQGLADLWVVDLPDGLTVPEAVDLYEASPEVEFAQPDYHYYLPEDPCAQPREPRLVTEISDSSDPAWVGDYLTYTVTIRNEGLGVATNVEVFGRTHFYRAARFVSARLAGDSSKGECVTKDEAAAARCRLDGLGPGETATFSMRLRLLDPGYFGGQVRVEAGNASGGPATLSEGTQVLADEVIPACTVVGTEGRDLIEGTPIRDVFCGRSGDDVLWGFGGNDVVIGGSGDDTLIGGSGDDVLRGREGDDRLRAKDGESGNDEAYGGSGNDTISADGGDQTRD